MAEIAIPLVALGATYIIAKHEREKNEPVGAESFTNMGRPANDLPGVSPPVPAINYPKTTPLSKRVKFGVNKYPNSNQTTDKYFNANVYEKVAETNPPGSVGSGMQPVIGLN